MTVILHLRFRFPHRVCLVAAGQALFLFLIFNLCQASMIYKALVLKFPLVPM